MRIFVHMKKTVVWVLSAVMSVSFILLLSLQLRYIKEMTAMRHQQFDENVKRSLSQVAHELELAEARRYLEEDIREMERNSNFGSIQIDGLFSQSQTFTFQNGQFTLTQTTIEPVQSPGVQSQTVPSSPSMPSLQVPRTQPQADNGNGVSARSRVMQQRQLEHYLANKSLVDEVIFNMLSSSGSRSLSQRVDNSFLATELADQLTNNGIDLPFHYILTTNTGRVIYTCCKDVDQNVVSNTYSQVVFHNDQPNRMGVIRVYFPTLDDYISKSVAFMLPSLIFMVILMLVFAFTLFIIMRQRKVTDMRNDFVNNMTHEFKTPISTISLAAQMLNDPAITKSPQMFKHISGVINDETKRLRFQVEKVLQMSMFERQSNTMKLKELDIDELINGVVNTFKLRVDNIGGTLNAQFETEDPFAMADEMHFTNVIFNLMDNAIKYKREDIPFELKIRTWNEPGKLMISVSDNGIGIRKEDLKKIFDKFYRVHTGNRHDVKGFGLGLAYVKKVIVNHKGTIKAESEFGNGTRFIISLPQQSNDE